MKNLCFDFVYLLHLDSDFETWDAIHMIQQLLTDETIEDPIQRANFFVEFEVSTMNTGFEGI